VSRARTKWRLKDRRRLGYALTRYDENGNRIIGIASQLRRRLGRKHPWSLSSAELMFLRLYGNRLFGRMFKDTPHKALKWEVESAYIAKLKAKYKPQIANFKAGDKIKITKYISLQKEKYEEVLVRTHQHPPLQCMNAD
jgi:hypothetical protein